MRPSSTKALRQDEVEPAGPRDPVEHGHGGPMLPDDPRLEAEQHLAQREAFWQRRRRALLRTVAKSFFYLVTLVLAVALFLGVRMRNEPWGFTGTLTGLFSPAGVAFVAAWRLEGLGRPKEAMEGYRRALLAEPYHVPSLVSLGRLLMAQGELPAACDVLEQALEPSGHATAIYRLLADCAQQAGDLDRQVRVFEEARARHRFDQELTCHLARAYEQAGQFEAAYLTYQECLAKASLDAAGKRAVEGRLRALGPYLPPQLLPVGRSREVSVP